MKILELTRTDGMAGAVQVTVTSAWDDDGGVVTHTFVGSIYGAPGPVVLVFQSGMQTFVHQPERFGVRFDENWVRKFYTDFNGEETTADAGVSDGGN